LIDGRVLAQAAERAAHVYCGPELPGDVLVSENPIIVVEVISPSTGRNDPSASSKAIFDCRT